MATKTKSNVAKSAKKSSFKFRWWYALIAVAIIAVVGIVVIRFSNASSVTNIYAAQTTNIFANSSVCPIGNMNGATLNGAGQWCVIGKYNSGYSKFRRTSDGRCAFMREGANDTKGKYIMYPSTGYSNGWRTVSETVSCDNI